MALLEEKDMNVDCEKIKELYQRIISQQAYLTIATSPSNNHNMFKCNSGRFYEFEDNDIPWEYCDGFTEVKSEWLLKIA